MDDMSAALERIIGRKLSAADGGTVADLNAMPQSLIGEARGLKGSPQLARALLAHYTDAQSRPYLANFLEDVVFGEVPAASWRRGGALTIDPPLAQQLTLPRGVVLAPLGEWPGRRTLPEVERWRRHVSWTGAPARPCPERTYLTVPPQGTVHLAAPVLEDAPDAAVAFRRWTASRLARRTASATPSSVEQLLALVHDLPPYASWSEDGKAAAVGLAREFNALKPAADEVPGFRGPDGWYADKP